VDHLCDTSDLVAAGIGEWIHDGWVYSYPSCYRHCRGPHSNYPGAKAAIGIWHFNSWGGRFYFMKPIMVLGIIFVIVGAIALGYHGITYTTHEKVFQIGPIEATKKTEKTIPLSPVLGGAALAAGIVFVIMGTRK